MSALQDPRLKRETRRRARSGEGINDFEALRHAKCSTNHCTVAHITEPVCRVIPDKRRKTLYTHAPQGTLPSGGPAAHPMSIV